jgi:RNA polymerase sigma-70 factor (ECF subfamily)
MESEPDEAKEVSRILREWSEGNEGASDELMPLVYEELRMQASRYLRRERKGHTLQTTALIHEAYLKLVNQHEVNWQNRSHFFGIAAKAMKRILVDYARARHREKRGGQAENIPLEDANAAVSLQKSREIIALDEALRHLSKFDPRQAEIVELRYFGGFSIDETADSLGISPATVKREWASAKAWLKREISR